MTRRRKVPGCSGGTSSGYLPAAVSELEYQHKTPGVLWSDRWGQCCFPDHDDLLIIVYFLAVSTLTRRGCCGVSATGQRQETVTPTRWEQLHQVGTNLNIYCKEMLLL